MSGLGMGLGLQRFQQSGVLPFVPPDDLDISGRNYESWKVNAYLVYHAFTLGTSNTMLFIKGNEDPTSGSLDAINELNSRNVAIDYNSNYNN